MDIKAEFTPNSIREAARLNRRWWRRALRTAGNVRVLVYLTITLWVSLDFIVKGLRATPPDLHKAGTGCALLGVAAVVLLLLSWRTSARWKKALAAQQKQDIRLTDAGIATTAPDGAANFTPWSAFASFRQGRYTLRLLTGEKGAVRAIPTDLLTPQQAGELRAVLLNHLPEQT